MSFVSEVLFIRKKVKEKMINVICFFSLICITENNDYY